MEQQTAPIPSQPVLYIPHGGGPWPFVELGLPRPEIDALAAYTRSIGALQPRPSAVLVVSAHWEAPVPTVMTGGRPPLYYDYYGFPEAAYRLSWPAPGAPKLARRVMDLLRDAGLPAAEDPERGFDHGTFVPMKLAFPQADLPTTQLSLVKGLDPATHLAIGRALRPLREEGVLIVGSGMSFHNMRHFRERQGSSGAERFDAWLTGAMQGPGRERALLDWTAAPEARVAHPREEHLLPLMVAAGAAGDAPGTVPYSGTFAGSRISAVHFG
ncbi:MAG: dioxygenase [Alphaproteobacteria bacterium]|nr:dioxygenase [Alphaproteobacteria bacterium]